MWGARYNMHTVIPSLKGWLKLLQGESSAQGAFYPIVQPQRMNKCCYSLLDNAY